MRHQCAAVIGLLTVALLAPVSPSQAASADPTGYWMKPDAERESKIEVFKCGKKKTNLCAKIAWLKEPNDSKGQPLHDVRNENPAMRPADHGPADFHRSRSERAIDLERKNLQSRGRPHLHRHTDGPFAQADPAQGLQGVAALRREELVPHGCASA